MLCVCLRSYALTDSACMYMRFIHNCLYVLLGQLCLIPCLPRCVWTGSSSMYTRFIHNIALHVHIQYCTARSHTILHCTFINNIALHVHIQYALTKLPSKLFFLFPDGLLHRGLWEWLDVWRFVANGYQRLRHYCGKPTRIFIRLLLWWKERDIFGWSLFRFMVGRLRQSMSSSSYELMG